MAKRILVVEDNPEIIELLIENVQEGFEITAVSTGDEGLHRALNEQFDAVILDIQLPILSGTEVCKRIRQEKQRLPIIMLTGKGSAFDKILGLEIGADDYLTKPFDVRELFLRLNAILARSKNLMVTAGTPKTHHTIGDLEIDLDNIRVTVAGKLVKLRPTEFAVLAALAAKPGVVLTKEELLEAIWGDSQDQNRSMLTTHLNRMRNKLDSDPQRYIKTVWGVGYLLRNDYDDRQ